MPKKRRDDVEHIAEVLIQNKDLSYNTVSKQFREPSNECWKEMLRKLAG